MRFTTRGGHQPPVTSEGEGLSAGGGTGTRHGPPAGCEAEWEWENEGGTHQGSGKSAANETTPPVEEAAQVTDDKRKPKRGPERQLWGAQDALLLVQLQERSWRSHRCGVRRTPQQQRQVFGDAKGDQEGRCGQASGSVWPLPSPRLPRARRLRAGRGPGKVQGVSRHGGRDL